MPEEYLTRFINLDDDDAADDTLVGDDDELAETDAEEPADDDIDVGLDEEE